MHRNTNQSWAGKYKVESFLPVSLGLISDGHIPNTRICVSNSRISIRVKSTICGALCLVGVACTKNRQVILLLTVVWYLQAETCLPLVKILKKMKNAKNNYIFFFNNVRVYRI